jgi:hypothetical protein
MLQMSEQRGPGAHPATYMGGTRSFLGRQSGWGISLTTHLQLAPRSKKEWSYLCSPSGPSWKVTGWNLLHLLQMSKQQTVHTCKLYLAAISKSGVWNMITCDIRMGSLYVTTDLSEYVSLVATVEKCQSIVSSQPKCSPLLTVRDFIPVVFRLMHGNGHEEHFKA